MQRNSLIAGLVLIILALAGVVLMPESGLRNARQTLIIHPPDSPTQTAVPEPEIIARPFDQLSDLVGSGTMPLLGLVILGVIVAVLGALLRAYLTPPSNAGPITPARSGLMIVSVLIVPIVACVLLLCAIPAVTYLGWQSASEVLGEPGQAAVSIEWPRHMSENDLVHLRVDWAYRADSAGSSRALTSFADLFGPDYAAVVDGTLSGDRFEIIPDEDFNALMSLDQENAFWLWEIAPEPGTLGPRTLTVTIDGTWEPVSGHGQPNKRTLAQISLPVTVGDPPVPTGAFIVPLMLASLAGPLLCEPWLYGFFKRRLGRDKRADG